MRSPLVSDYWSDVRKIARDVIESERPCDIADDESWWPAAANLMTWRSRWVDGGGMDAHGVVREATRHPEKTFDVPENPEVSTVENWSACCVHFAMVEDVLDEVKRIANPIQKGR